LLLQSNSIRIERRNCLGHNTERNERNQSDQNATCFLDMHQHTWFVYQEPITVQSLFGRFLLRFTDRYNDTMICSVQCPSNGRGLDWVIAVDRISYTGKTRCFWWNIWRSPKHDRIYLDLSTNVKYSIGEKSITICSAVTNFDWNYRITTTSPYHRMKSMDYGEVTTKTE
jgi:hypothetical protein